MPKRLHRDTAETEKDITHNEVAAWIKVVYMEAAWSLSVIMRLAC